MESVSSFFHLQLPLQSARVTAGDDAGAQAKLQSYHICRHYSITRHLPSSIPRFPWFSHFEDASFAGELCGMRVGYLGLCLLSQDLIEVYCSISQQNTSTVEFNQVKISVIVRHPQVFVNDKWRWKQESRHYWTTCTFMPPML